MANHPIRILLADAHNLVRKGLIHLISLEPDMAVVEQAATAEQVRTLAIEHRPDVVLVDVKLLSPISPIPFVRYVLPDVAIIVLADAPGTHDIDLMLHVGADACLYKTMTPEEFTRRIREVRGRGRFVSGAITCRMVEALRQADQVATGSGDTGNGERDCEPHCPSLTRRELEILRLLAQGERNWEIALHLSVSENTVKNHLKDLFAKLGAKNRVQAVSLAIRWGLIPSGGQHVAHLAD